LAARGHRLVFFERDVPYYAAHRDATEIAGVDLRLYPELDAGVRRQAEEALDGADAGIVTSYCPDAEAAASLVLASRAAVKVYYDLDTPVTLERLANGEQVEYLPGDGLGGFDLVLSFTGGRALDALRERLGARRAAALYGSVDPDAHRPAAASPWAVLSYLGTFAADRQPALDALFLEPARRRPEVKFLLGGSMYPGSFDWRPNVWFRRHVPPREHADFYGAARLTLNITRRAMAEFGYCPSGRIFEAAACGAPVLSDDWEGLDSFFEPGREILVARDTGEALEAIDLDGDTLARVGRAARERALAEHSGATRALELERALADAHTTR
jgi:spore maturation protein CgeB